jgi:cell division protein FtsB
MIQGLGTMRAPLTRFAYVLVLLAVVSYAFTTLCGPRGISAWLEKERQIQSLEKRNSDLNRENERVRDRIDRLTNDPTTQGRAAQERLNYVDKNDKVYVTGDPAPAPAPAPAR